MKLDKFHEHEALHSAHLVLDTWNDHVAEHPYVSADPELTKLADTASDSMMALYQEIGQRQDTAVARAMSEGALKMSNADTRKSTGKPGVSFVDGALFVVIGSMACALLLIGIRLFDHMGGKHQGAAFDVPAVAAPDRSAD